MKPQTVRGPNGKPERKILDSGIAPAGASLLPVEQVEARKDIYKAVGARIKAQGGNKVLVVCPDSEIIRAFKRMNPQSERFIFECNTAKQVRDNPRAEVMVLGPFWAHPHWDAIYREIREKTRVAPHIRVSWFPF